MLLDVRAVSKTFGAVKAVNDVSLSVSASEFVGLIGPNGAGKTTLFNLITGILRVDSGEVRIGGNRIIRPQPMKVAKLGVGRTFQLGELFTSMTVLENVASVCMASGSRRHDAFSQAASLLTELQLGELQDRLPSELSFGLRRRVELARALALKPRLLLADEVMAGVSPGEVDDIGVFFEMIVANGVSVIAIEHNLDFVLRCCKRLVVLDRGRVIADGVPGKVVRERPVIDAYLGSEVSA